MPHQLDISVPAYSSYRHAILNRSVTIYVLALFSLALPIKSALFALALVLALSGLGLFLAKVALYNNNRPRAAADAGGAPSMTSLVLCHFGLSYDVVYVLGLSFMPCNA